MSPFPWKTHWFVKAPKRVSFVWTAARFKILTNDNLLMRGFYLVDWCCMCSVSWINSPIASCDVVYVMNFTLLCLMWIVWKESNSCTFEDKEQSLDQLKSLLFCTLIGWFRAWGFTHCHSILEFLDPLNFPK